MKEVRIVIADDHAMFRDALRSLLEEEPGLRVVGEASDGRGAVNRVLALKPDLLLLDLAMPSESGMKVLQRLHELRLGVRTIILTAEIRQDEAVEALKVGACGIIVKDMASQMLFKAIHAVMAGEFWVGHEEISNLMRSLTSPRPPEKGAPLTRREQEIVDAVADGCTNKDIARKFGLSENTVKHHLTKIFPKLGVTNRLELAMKSLKR